MTRSVRWRSPHRHPYPHRRHPYLPRRPWGMGGPILWGWGPIRYPRHLNWKRPRLVWPVRRVWWHLMAWVPGKSSWMPSVALEASMDWERSILAKTCNQHQSLHEASTARPSTVVESFNVPFRPSTLTHYYQYFISTFSSTLWVDNPAPFVVVLFYYPWSQKCNPLSLKNL